MVTWHTQRSCSSHLFPSGDLPVLEASCWRMTTAPCVPEQGPCWRTLLPTTMEYLFCSLSFICSCQPLHQSCLCSIIVLSLVLSPGLRSSSRLILLSLPAPEIRISLCPSLSIDCLQVVKGRKEELVSLTLCNLSALLQLIENLINQQATNSTVCKSHMFVTCSEVQEYSGGDARATGVPQGWDQCLEKRTYCRTVNK